MTKIIVVKSAVMTKFIAVRPTVMTKFIYVKPILNYGRDQNER